MDEDNSKAVALMLKLQHRKETLESKLRDKCSELKKLCLSEYELTGSLPMETPFEPDESPPKVRKKIGTMYPYSEEVLGQLISSGQKSSPKRKKLFKSWGCKCPPLVTRSKSPSNTWPTQRVSPSKPPSRSHPYKTHKCNAVKIVKN